MHDTSSLHIGDGFSEYFVQCVTNCSTSCMIRAEEGVCPVGKVEPVMFVPESESKYASLSTTTSAWSFSEYSFQILSIEYVRWIYILPP